MRPIAIAIALVALIGLEFFIISAVYAEPEYVHVAGPFYLTYFETRDQMSLFRCPTGAPGGVGCAIDGLPDATVFAAGADARYVVVARHPHDNRTVTEYFYFARVDRESQGWGNGPEKIIGPISEDEFGAAQAKLGLPPLSIVMDDLK
ncbi:MAG TPA: hypothetical protein VHZ78_03535 [Rhizomicrobium sp.]|nr:hypothetical protein [Rhizomicrobium sp.]